MRLILLLFSRIGASYVGPASYFSFNNPNGMCPKFSGIGKILELDVTKAVDENKSWNEGMINLPAFASGNYYFKQYTSSGFWDLDKKFKDYSEEKKSLVLRKSSCRW